MAVSRDSRELETKYHIPTVSMGGINVVPYGLNYFPTYVSGMPLRFVAFPFPFTGMTREVYRSFIEGKDQLSGAPMMQAIIDGLTKPLTAHEQMSGPSPQAKPEPRYLKADTEDNLRRLFKERHWTDGSPIILPTEARVKEMLKGTSHKPDEMVKIGGPFGNNRPFTVEKVAIIGVMAGAKPSYMPLLLALSTVAPASSSTTSNASMIVVNGPIRKEIDMNSGIGALGPDTEANSVIGRSMNLMSFILKGYKEGVTSFSSLSNPLRYNNVTIAENEEALPPGWKSYAVQQGYKPTDSVVTVLSGWNFLNSSGNTVQHYAPQDMMRDYMGILAATGAATILMDPSVAVQLHDIQGFKSKEALSEWFSKNVTTRAQTYWGSAIAAAVRGPLARQGLEPYASWLKVSDDSMIHQFPDPNRIRQIVVGGNTASVWFATDFTSYGKGILIDDWR